MAIQALAPYYNDDTIYTCANENRELTVSKTVRQCVNEALVRLGSMMNESGVYKISVKSAIELGCDTVYIS